MAKENITALTDEELIHRYRNSHKKIYLGELYQRYTHLVFGVCLKYFKNEEDAEDNTMQIFELLISELKRHHITAFRPWLYVVVKNHCMMEFRNIAKNNKVNRKLQYELGGISVENTEESHLLEEGDKEGDKEFVLEHLKNGIDELREEQQTCIELFYLKDCSYAEVSKITGYSLNEVKSYIQNGKKNLKRYITAKNEQEQKGNEIS